MEFSNEISVNGMVLTPRGVFVVWEYDWLVPGESDEEMDTDGESLVNRDVGAPEDSSVTEPGGESDESDDTIPAVTHTVTFKCIGVMREHKYQEVLRRAKELRSIGVDVPVKISALSKINLSMPLQTH